MKHKLIILAIIIHAFFYISALKTHTLDYFFPWGNVHEYQGIDFYQVPNGAHAYLTGGKFTGELAPSEAPYAYGNSNVYHPFFTFVIGGLLQLFRPEVARHLWFAIHAMVTSILVFILFKRYKTHKNFSLAVFIYLGLFPHYLEIWNGQYHFLLDAAIFFLLLAAVRKKEKFLDAFAYAGSLLVKPIGLLWIIPLLFKKRFKTVCVGIGIFLLAIVVFLIDSSGWYYITNIVSRVKGPIGGPPGVFTLDALLRYGKISLNIITLIKAGAVIGLLFVQIKKKPNLFVSLFIWTSYYLLFYDLVFEYHYATLAPFFALGLLTQKSFQSKLAKLLCLTYALPTPFFIFHYFQYGAKGHEVLGWGWVILVLFRILPLILLNMIIIFKYKNNDHQAKHI